MFGTRYSKHRAGRHRATKVQVKARNRAANKRARASRRLNRGQR